MSGFYLGGDNRKFLISYIIENIDKLSDADIKRIAEMFGITVEGSQI